MSLFQWFVWFISPPRSKPIVIQKYMIIDRRWSIDKIDRSSSNDSTKPVSVLRSLGL